MSTQSRIIALFELQNEQEKDVAIELTSLCSIYSLTPESLKFKWEAFALNSGCSMKPSLPYVKHLRKSLQREFEKNLKKIGTAKGKMAIKRSDTINLSEYGITSDSQDDSVEGFLSSVFNTSTQHSKVMPLTPSSSVADTQLSQVSSQFLTRKTAHVIDGQYNPELPLRGAYVKDAPVKFNYLQKPIAEYRYMFEKLKEKADGLDDRIEYIGSLIAEEYQIEVFGNPSRPGQEPIYGYGRICSDSSEGSLNDQSVLLQLSKDAGMGRRVRLDLSKVSEYSLFPGQVVGVYGTNINGDKFHVEKILLPPLPDAIDSEIDITTKPVEVIVAAGPYTLSEDFSYQPLEELLKKCEEDKPDVIVLMGPFVSAKHPRVINGKIGSLPEHIFEEQISKRLESYLNANDHSHAILIPHADDMTHLYPLFPQPPLTSKVKHVRMHMLSNPSFFSINGHTIATGNIDILLRLVKEELSRGLGQTDRFSRLSRHLLQQRTYYPLFPNALGDSIDSEQYVNIQLPWRPSILILPSQFKCFVKNIDGVVCINPGYLCKSLAAGSYSRMVLYPTTDQDKQVRVDLINL